MPVLPCKHPLCGLKNTVLQFEGMPYGSFSWVASDDLPCLVLNFEDSPDG